MPEPTTVAFDRLCRAFVERGTEFLFVVLFVVVSIGALSGTVAGQSAPDCSTVTYNGDGTSVNPHEVSNVDQLQCIEDQGLNLNYRVVSDIDASETAFWNGGDGFEPIGDTPVSGTPFNGTFDGDGHEITDLDINRQTEDNVGLFGGVGTPGTVTNVSVVDATVAGDNYVGGLVGDNRGAVTKSSASGDISGNDNVGGLVGNNRGTVEESYSIGDVSGTGFDSTGGLVGKNVGGTVKRSYATGDVSGNTDVGGLVGRVTDAGIIENSYATGSVSGGNVVGGLVGNNFRGTVERSYANGTVSGSSNDVGGFVGFNGDNVNESYATGDVSGDIEVGGLVGDNGGTIEKSYATGDVSGDIKVGGLVGFSSSVITDAYARGNVTGNQNVGGVVGLNGDLVLVGDANLTRTYATGVVSGTTNVSGLVGFNRDGFLSDSYLDEVATGQADAIGASSPDGSKSNLVGFSSDTDGDNRANQMIGTAAETNMTGFDFTNTWETVSGDYPILAWQTEDGENGGPLSANNPFADSGGNPVSRGTVISRIVEWNLNGSINGTTYTRSEIIGFIVQWNLAS